MDQTTNYGMNFQNINNNMNQINNFNGFNNPMLNQYNQINPMMNQMNNYDQINPILNQMNTYNQNNPMLNQMYNNNQNNPMLNQINYYNQCNPLLNQMGNYNQNNIILNQMNLMKTQMMMIQNMNQIMKQINEINEEKKLKEKLRNLYNLNQNQIELIISIIKFYKENDNEYMNIDNPNQIKNMIFFLSLNYNKLDISDNIKDPLYYIEEPKKMIKFINSNYKEYKVKIPLSITKYDLYSIAQIYKFFHNNNKHGIGNHSNILLIHNNLILNRDETSIECINENDILIIIEPRNFPDNSYYKSLKERNKEKGSIIFIFSSGKKINRIFPDDIKICEIYKSINLEFGLDINSYYIYAKGRKLNLNGQMKGSFLFGLESHIFESNLLNKQFFGKIIMAKIIYNKKIEYSGPIGILDSIKVLKEIIYTLNHKKIKKLKIENKVIEEGDIRSLFSLGIKNDFTCFVEYEE